MHDILQTAKSQNCHLIAFAFLFSVFVNILMLTGPLFMLQVYDRVLGSRSESTLVTLLILVLGLYTLMWLLDFARTRLLAPLEDELQSSTVSPLCQACWSKPIYGTMTAGRCRISRNL